VIAERGAFSIYSIELVSCCSAARTLSSAAAIAPPRCAAALIVETVKLFNLNYRPRILADHLVEKGAGRNLTARSAMHRYAPSLRN
jgi:hypothetical protein